MNDMQQANLQAFVNEIIKDEDARIGALAQRAAEEAAAKERDRLVKVAALKDAQAQAEADVAVARQQADARLSESTAAMIRDVAERAAILGQQEQLRRDQQVIQQLLEKQANMSSDAAALTAAKAVQGGLKAGAQLTVTDELDKKATAAAEITELGTMEVNSAQQAVKVKFDEARSLSDAAVAEASNHVLQQDKDLRRLKIAARSQVEDAERRLAVAQAAGVEQVRAAYYVPTSTYAP